MHLKLQRGVTGFRDFRELPLPGCDLAAFRAHNFAAARMAGGRVIEAVRSNEPVYTNFSSVVIELAGTQVAILLNNHIPIIGFGAVPIRPLVPIRFIDDDRLATAFKAISEYILLTRSELEEPVTSDACEHLAPAELKQLKYWRPARIGDILFNDWD